MLEGLKHYLRKYPRLLIAPAAFAHTHRVNVPRGGNKYIATSWVLFQRADAMLIMKGCASAPREQFALRRCRARRLEQRTIERDVARVRVAQASCRDREALADQFGELAFAAHA